MRFSEACIGDQNGTEQRIGARVRRSRQKEARGAVLAKELGAPTDMVEPLCGLWRLRKADSGRSMPPLFEELRAVNEGFGLKSSVQDVRDQLL